MGEPAWERMPELVERLAALAEDQRITSSQGKKICSELGLGDRVDTLIAELKGSGVIIPKLGSLAEVSRASTPLHELNPSIFVLRAESHGFGRK
jgi:hypothetical protein